MTVITNSSPTTVVLWDGRKMEPAGAAEVQDSEATILTARDPVLWTVE